VPLVLYCCETCSFTLSLRHRVFENKVLHKIFATKINLIIRSWKELKSKGFRQWCTIFRITGFVDFFPHPEFEITRKHKVSEDGFLSVFRWREREREPYLFGPFSDWGWIFLRDESLRLPSPKDGIRSSFQNGVLFSCLEFQRKRNMHKLSDSGCRLQNNVKHNLYPSPDFT
jgi:hypothetical protein